MRRDHRIGAILLAAGQGTRFGAEPKLMAISAGKPIVRYVAEAALKSSARPVVVVLGAHAVPVRGALDGLPLQFVENRDHAAGLSTSLRVGLAALPADAEAAIVLLGDMPCVTSLHLNALIAAYVRAVPRPSAVIPVHLGRRGNPVLIDHHQLAAALSGLTGDRGAGGLISRRDDVIEIAADSAIAFDVDTPDALDASASR